MIINILKSFIIVLIFFSPLSLFALEKVSLQLQWKYQFQFAGYIMAKEKGFYKDLGLDLEIKEWKSGIDMVDEVVRGHSTFAVARPTAFVNEDTVDDIKFLGAIYQSSPLVLLTDKSLGINSIKDFQGKTLMSTGDLNTDASLISMMYSQGVNFKKLNMKQPSFNVKDLLTGKTDLIASYISNEPYVLKQMGGEPVIFDPKDYGFDFYNDILITNTTTAEENPKLVKSFFDATIKGWKYAFDNIEQSALIIHEKYNTQNKSLDALIYEGKTLKPLAINGKEPLGSISKDKMKHIFNIYKLLGVTKLNDIDFEKLIYRIDQEKIELTNKEREYLDKNTVRIGISPWYPITFYDKKKGTIEGIGIEMLHNIANRLQMKIEYVPARWNILLEKFKNKELDLLPTTYYTEERSKFGTFSKPYLNIKEYLYVHEDSNIKSFEDLENKTIAMVKKYGAIEKIKEKYPDIIIKEVDTLEESIQMVVNKEVDAIFNTQFSIESFLMKNHIFSIKPIYQTSFKSSSLHFFTRQENPILKNILQKGLDTVKEQEMDMIVSNWIRKSSNSLFSLSQLRYINEHPRVKICINPNWMPIEFADSGIPKGITVDILKLVSEKTNFKFDYVPTNSWSESQKFLQEKRCDLLPSASITSERKKYAKFTRPYLSYNLAIITPDNKPLVSNFEDIIDKTMSRKKGSGLISVLKEKYPDLEILETKGYKEAFEKVQHEEVYFTIATLPVLSYYKNKYDFDNLQVSGYIKMKYDLSMMVRDDKDTLLKILDKTLLEISNEQKKLINEKWINQETTLKIDYHLIFQILIVSLIIIGLFIYKQVMLKKSIKEFEELMDATMEGILVLKNLKCIDVNESALKILKYEKKDILRKNIFDLLPLEYHKLVKEKMKQPDSEPYELKAVTKNGKEISILARGRDIKNGTLRLVGIVDITLLKQQEEQLLQQAKLVSMGEMIGNIAHQWRQPLSVISTSATGMKIQKEYGILEDKFFYEACDAIDYNAQYLSQTIDDFRDFIKGDRYQKRLSVKEFMERFIHLIEASAKIHDIKIVTDFQDDFMVKVYENELKQCFMNLFNNSKDILNEKAQSKKLFLIEVLKENDRVVFSFTDNGGGIPKDVFPNIFDPYFTTKHKSQGTGLGLSMTYNLVTSGMEGTIEAQNVTYRYENKSYSGAKFSISLPL